MNLYSLMVGSFYRTGNYPLEANYIFETIDDLKNFYSDEVEKATLHKGLLKIVEDNGDGKLALYWVTKKKTNDELEFTFLTTGDNSSDILSLLEELELKIDQEIQDRKTAIDAIYGTEDKTEVPEDLNTLLELAEAVKNLRKSNTEISEQIKAIVGSEDDDIIAYLETLDYLNLTKISEALHHFLNTIDDEDPSINTLPELQEFLRGFEYTHNLYECFVDFWNAIEGNPLPNALFRTLRGIQDFVETLASVVKNRCDNLQTELDQTQVGVGLSGDGGFNADQETYYLKSATSIMNALKILDSLINLAINNVNILSGETNTAKINIIKEVDKTTVYADVKLSKESGNDILAKSDGLYHRIDTEYIDGILTVKVNGDIRQLHILGLSMIVESAEYDPTQEAIIIIFKLLSGDTLKVVIPAGALISEWEVDNSQSDKVIELVKIRVVAGGADKLSADVRLSTNKYNILKKDGNTLLVDGRASNIIYNGDITVYDKLNELVSKDAELQTAIDNINLKNIEQDAAIDNLSDKITSVENNITNNIDSKIDNLTDKLNSEIERSTNKDNEFSLNLNDLNTAINNESVRALAKESALETQMNTNNLLLTEKTTNIESNLNLFAEKTEQALTKKIEVITLEKIDTLNYMILVDGNSIGTISIPKDKYLQDVSLVGTALRFTFNDGNVTSIKDIDLKAITDIIAPDVSNLLEGLLQVIEKINEEINRAKLEESKLESQIEREVTRATLQESFINDKLEHHIYDYSNPHHVTATQLGVYTKEWIDETLRDMTSSSSSDLKEVSDKLNQKLDDFNSHIRDYDNPHRVTKDQVGLGNVDNTSDMDKPISTATQDALNKKADIIHTHTKADIVDLEDMPIIAKGFVTLLTELPENPAKGDKYVLRTYSGSNNYAYELLEWDSLALNWKQKLVTTGGLVCIIDENVWKLNSTGPERILDASDYKYFYNKMYDETKDLIEDIDWEEDDSKNETNGLIRLKITYKTKYGDPDPESQIEGEVTNPYKAKAVKYIDIDKARFLANAYSRPATQLDIDKGYAATLGEPMLILVFTTDDYVAIRLNELMNIYDEVDTDSVDLTVTDWTGDKGTSYKISANLNIASTKGQENSISLHINSTNGDKGLYGVLHTLTTNSIALNPSTGTGLKYLTADLKINNSLNDVNDVLLSIASSGLSAQIVIGDYD